MSKRRSECTPMRVRCDKDDGSGDHDAFDIQLPTRMGEGGPLSALRRITKCRCKGEMVVLFDGAEEPMVTNARDRAAAPDSRREGGTSAPRSASAPFRVRCPRDDGTGLHYAVDVQAPVALSARSPLSQLMRMDRCGCTGTMVILGSGDEEPSVRNARPPAEAPSGG